MNRQIKHKKIDTTLRPHISLLRGERRVFVGLSGGVDSSVSAALLKKSGYDVTGVFIKVWHPDFLPCDWKRDRLDAMRVCAKLEIPFLMFDFEKEYKKEIIDFMIEEYRRGKTPNPDVMCNKHIKFGAFLDKARQMGASHIATGHYARKYETKNIKYKNATKNLKQETYKLLIGNDNNKDQSYFLWTLTQEQLKHSFFPIGEHNKLEVRKIAEKFNLPTAQKKDSQGLCFIGKLNMRDFLKNYIKEQTGDILNERGDVIGHHDGVTFLTIGQRHGFTITCKSTHDKPYYVISKDIENNTITVSDKMPTLREDADVNFQINKRKIRIKDVNWIIGQAPDLNNKYKARTRYRQKLQDCKIIKNQKKDDLVIVEFDDNQDNTATGQSLVFYDGEECLGGGIIY